MQKVIIGSRGSDLALWQANYVKNQLEKLSCNVEIKIIQTQGDKIQNLSFDKLEGKGFFTKEIEQELLEKKIDLAVHSHKDLETNSPNGLIVGAVSEREDPSELLLINKESIDLNKKWKIKSNATIGTSSARRKSLIKTYRKDLNIEELRGNVPTRIQKLKEKKYDAIIIAKAGVSRLNLDLSEFENLVLDPLEFIPAPAQGVLALQVRENDFSLRKIITKINNLEVEKNIAVERAILNEMKGGCQLPLGVYCDGINIYTSYSKSSNDEAKLNVFKLKQQFNAKEIISQLL